MAALYNLVLISFIGYDHSTLGFNVSPKYQKLQKDLKRPVGLHSACLPASEDHLASRPMLFQSNGTEWALIEMVLETIHFLQEHLQLVNNHPPTQLAQEWNIGIELIVIKTIYC